MPKNSQLFGKYLRLLGKSAAKSFDKRNIAKPIPVKMYGRKPSASSQTGLYHEEDFNYYSKVSFSLKKTRRKLKPLVFKKDFYSERLGSNVTNLRVTTSALHAMDDAGGFDNYIMETSPYELRSQLGERLRNVMHFYQAQPTIKKWQLPWKVFLSRLSRSDPYYARHTHLKRKRRSERVFDKNSGIHSPYYLPAKEADLTPERQFFDATKARRLNLWWKKSPALEKAFRKRLAQAKPFELAHASHKLPNGFYTGRRQGGGGKSGNTVHRRSKTHKYREIRPY